MLTNKSEDEKHTLNCFGAKKVKEEKEKKKAGITDRKVCPISNDEVREAK